MNKRLAVLFGLFVMVALGCGERDIEQARSGAIAASPSQISFPQVEFGVTEERSLSLVNTSLEESLTLFDVDFVAGEGGNIEALSVEGIPELPFTIEAGEQLNLQVLYSPSDVGLNSRGELRVISSDPSFTRDDPLVVPITTLANVPELLADPPVVRFQRIQPGQSAERTLQLTNVGSAPLTIFEPPSYGGGDDFRVLPSDRNFPVQLRPYDAEAASTDPGAYILDVGVSYRPLGDGADSGEVLIESDDGGARGQRRIDVTADADAPCIEVDGRFRNLGLVPIGESGMDRVNIRNCGSRALVIDDVFFDEPNPRFTLQLGPWDTNGDGRVDSPVSIPPGGQDAFNIRFVPLEEQTEQVTVVIGSNDPVQPALTLDVTARGAIGTCPTAVALASVEGQGSIPQASITAVPLNYVILDGRQSSDEDGNVVAYNWEILERPPGTNVSLGPTQSDPTDQDDSRRRFRPLTAGVYRFALTVVDDSGFQSCNQAEVTVTAIPDQNIHIELTWTNPADPDETDDFGSDLDLHLTKMGPGNWFEAPYSIFYLNPNRDENPIWIPEDPSLDIDVRDGAGPENITMATPDHCQWYSVGVHYYQEVFATAYATVRIYINGSLRYERPFFPLESTRNFWDVARIHWNSTTNDATIVEVDTFYPIEPAGQAPQVTADMSSLGLCTAEGLY